MRAWVDNASCQGAAPAFDEQALFDAELQRVALRVCEECPVTQVCGEWAARDRFTGVAGGRVFWLGRVLTVQGRRQRLRQRRKSA